MTMTPQKVMLLLYTSLVLVLSICFVNAQDSYLAAVYEHAPSTEDTARDTIFKNIDLYRQATGRAHSGNADIIVFPEYGLTTLAAADNPADYAIRISGTYPYTQERVLQELATIAVENHIYVVVNLIEKAYSEINATIYYNTNLVFGKDGHIVTKYRKINLYNEENITPGNETVTFTTDFGVTFGLFTCFDILFQKPSRDIFVHNTVTDVVFPLAWFSTMPFYAALSLQHGYAVANGVNLLAANYDNPAEGNGGSGIFFSNGQIAETYIGGTRSSRLLLQQVRKIDARKPASSCVRIVPMSFPGNGIGLPQTNITDFVTHRDFKSSDFKFKDIDLSKSNVSTQVCHNKFCCTFNITIDEPNNNEVYKVMAFNGNTNFDGVQQHVRVCSLLVCKNSNVDSCGERINGTTKFSRISVNGDLPFDNVTFYQPLTLNYDLNPIVESSYCVNEGEDTTSIKLTTTKQQDKVVVFGIYGRSGAINVHGLGLFFFTILIVTTFNF